MYRIMKSTNNGMDELELDSLEKRLLDRHRQSLTRRTARSGGRHRHSDGLFKRRA